ncbi:MAG: threonine ammonia-lyase [Veillonellaceae bacterium]|nr:threonine ammonia-lyase [Veillonellaceae bacterium]
MNEFPELADIQSAAAALAGIAHETPLEASATFSAMVGQPVYLKLENLQKTGSFKLRGAFNKIRLLSATEKARGVIAASAGNHAYAARRTGIRAVIVMPETAPLSKVSATRGYGAEVVLAGSSYDEAYGRAKELSAAEGLTFVHAFDDPAVMAGQGTIGLEILRELPAVRAVIVPVGGGGLIAGVAKAVKSLAPQVKIIGVQAEGADAMVRSKAADRLIQTPSAVTIADGIAVMAPGSGTFEMVRQYVDEMVTIDDEAIASAILMLLERAKLVVEGAGAIGLAALLQGRISTSGPIACLISGGNIDVNFIARIIERGLVKAGRRVILTTCVVDKPGSLQKLLTCVAANRGNVLYVHHDRIQHDVPLGQAKVQISLETRDSEHTAEILAALQQEGYQVTIN